MKKAMSAQARREMLIDAAERLFIEKGYAASSVEDVMRLGGGIAKGTFYYHFTSKEQLLTAVIKRRVEIIAGSLSEVFNAPNLSAIEKLSAFAGFTKEEKESDEMIERLHEPENAAMHILSLTESTKAIAPLFASVIKQGNCEGVFDCSAPGETAELLLAAAQFLFDRNIFGYTGQERRKRAEAFAVSAEKLLGASPGSLAFLKNCF